MAQVDPALRERIRAQRKQMERGGLLINNKTLQRLRFRVLPPPEGELPGTEYQSYYCKTLGKGTTSPLSFGVACPVNDHLESVYLGDDAGAKDYVKDYVKRERQYWIAGIDRQDEGTPESPRIRILRGKHSVYQRIVDWLAGDDDAENICDPVEGRDLLIKKTGAGLETEWNVEKLDRSPISEDDAMAEAWIDLAGRFIVRKKFYPIKLDVLAGIYEGLTGEGIPEQYLDPINEVIAGHEPDPSVAEGAEETEEVVETAAEEQETVEVSAGEDEATAEEDEVDVTGTICTFENDEQQLVQGTIFGVDPEDERCYLIVEDGASEEDPKWSIPIEDVTVLQDEPEEVTEAEETPAPAPAATRKTTKSVAPKAAPPKQVTKASVSKTPPVKAAASKAPPAKAPATKSVAAKPTTVKAGAAKPTMGKPAAKPPVKAVATATRPKGLPHKPAATASSAIKDRMKKR